MKRLKWLVQKLYFVPSPSLNTRARKALREFNPHLKDFRNPVVLNLGCGERFLGHKGLDAQFVKTVVNFDIKDFPSVDVVGDARSLPFKNESFHGMICQAVLEHVEDPVVVVEEIHRTMQRGGILYAEIPFIQGYHPSPKDFHRFSLEGVNKLFAKFSPIELGVAVGPSSALSWILREYLTGLFTGFSRNRGARALALFIVGWLTFPIKYLDLLFANRAEAHRIASGMFFLGKKT
jgi:SAM-dependent methyltransferase